MMSEEEIKLLQEKLDFVKSESDSLRKSFFAQKAKIRELYAQIAKYEAKENNDTQRAIKAAKFEAEKLTAERLCDVFDDTFGFHAYEITDRIRSTYNIPTKYGY